MQMVCENDEFRSAKIPETKELEVFGYEMRFPHLEKSSYTTRLQGWVSSLEVTVVMDRSEVEHMFTLGQNKDN
ncbi:hypothetical protein P7H17_24055 [Paenibacillus larvae]|nr:hypothetical protein [Paenibacillus larvae]MDT2288506.1 hypothetical protein [Paenibacillus larvae]